VAALSWTWDSVGEFVEAMLVCADAVADQQIASKANKYAELPAIFHALKVILRGVDFAGTSIYLWGD
jgi:hypothetical protein